MRDNEREQIMEAAEPPVVKTRKTRCLCERRDLGDGVLRREWPAADCPTHGCPDPTRWYVGNPLRKHMHVVNRATGETLHPHAAHLTLRKPGSSVVDCTDWMRTFRDETPEETLARLWESQ